MTVIIIVPYLFDRDLGIKRVSKVLAALDYLRSFLRVAVNRAFKNIIYVRVAVCISYRQVAVHIFLYLTYRTCWRFQGLRCPSWLSIYFLRSAVGGSFQGQGRCRIIVMCGQIVIPILGATYAGNRRVCEGKGIA